MAAVTILGGVATLVGPLAASAGSGGGTSVASVSSHGEAGNDWSARSAISADGRFVAFVSSASNLVPGDTNGQSDVLVRDRLAGITERVSISTTGRQGNDGSSGYQRPAISSDGRFVAFVSSASNLVPGDTNRLEDVFVRDRLAGTTERVSISTTEQQSNRPSYFDPTISADGRFITFNSEASNLVPGDTNNDNDVFVRDRLAQTTQRVSLSTTGQQANSTNYDAAISADGRFVAFTSFARNLVPGDTNGQLDIFVRDRLAGTTERVSISTAGRQGNLASGNYKPAISANGRFVAFDGWASNLVPDDTNNDLDVFVRDRVAGTTQRVSLSPTGQQLKYSWQPAVSANGRFVAFSSNNSNPTHLTVFVRDLIAGTTKRASVSTTGQQANHDSGDPSISADGKHIAFNSAGSNLVPGDTNHAEDVFVRDPVLGSAG